jgi:hypothetical protein
MLKDKEKQIIQSLYNFYKVEEKPKKQEFNFVTQSTTFTDGDPVMYDAQDGKKRAGIYKGLRKEDGKYKIQFVDTGGIMYCSKGRVKKIESEKEESKITKQELDKIQKLIRILNQMVSDGDLSQEAVDIFIKDLEIEKKHKLLDPYNEENWDDDVQIIKKEPIQQPGQVWERPPYDRPAYRGC